MNSTNSISFDTCSGGVTGERTGLTAFFAPRVDAGRAGEGRGEERREDEAGWAGRGRRGLRGLLAGSPP